MVKKREPKKGQGVPKETPEQNSLGDLQAILTERLPEGHWARLPEEPGVYRLVITLNGQNMGERNMTYGR